jgi:hypothetical protein
MKDKDFNITPEHEKHLEGILANHFQVDRVIFKPFKNRLGGGDISCSPNSAYRYHYEERDQQQPSKNQGSSIRTIEPLEPRNI